MRLWKCSPPDTYHTMDQEPSIFKRNLLREEGGRGGGGGEKIGTNVFPVCFPGIRGLQKPTFDVS